jgi:hypothetical protein
MADLFYYRQSTPALERALLTKCPAIKESTSSLNTNSCICWYSNAANQFRKY